MKKNIYLLAIALITSCSQGTRNEEGELITVKINLEATPSKKEIADFQKRFSIRLVPLETTDASVLGVYSRIIVSGSDVFILDGKQNAIFRYDTGGKFIRKIDRQGNGPQEYNRAKDIAVSNDKLYVTDMMNVLQYDLEGNYINKFPTDRTYQLTIGPSGNLVAAGSYTDEYMISVYDASGTKIASHLPREEKFADMIQTTNESLGLYDGGIYLTNYFDPAIYYIKDNEVKPIFQFDFGQNNIPADFSSGSPEDKLDKFDLHRKKSVMGINCLTVNKDWVIFAPDKFKDFYVVYYDRKRNTYITNKGFEAPYSAFFGKFNAPKGYNHKSGEYYSAVSSFALRSMLIELAEKDPEYLQKYKFLKGIDPAKISEDDNPWLVFYTLK